MNTMLYGRYAEGRNDVKARTTLLLPLLDEHQLRFSKYETAQELWGAILKTFSGNEATKKTKKNQLKQQYGNFKAEGSETLEQTFNRLQAIIKYEDINQIDEDDIKEMDIKWNMALLSMRADRFWKKTGKKIIIQGSKEEEPAPKALMAIDGVRWDWSCMANEEENHALVSDDEAPTEFALMAKSSSSSENEVEARLVVFKTQEIKFCEKIRGLEFDVESKNNKIKLLMNELEKVKKEKDGLDSKPTGFESASKDLDTLLGSQRTDKNKEGFGYNAVSPPPAQVYSPLKKDMSWTRLPEFANDTITDYSRPSPSIESNTSDLQNSNAFVSEHGESSNSIMSKPMIKFLKASDSPTVIRTNKTETARKPLVKYVEMYRNTSKSPKVRGNQRNWNNLKSQQLGKHFLMKNKACFKCGHFDHLAYDCGVWVEKGKNWPKNNFTHNNVTPRADLLKTGRTPIADSGCSRHMTGNISYLSDYEPYDGGYLSFGQGGGKITGKDFKLKDDTNVLLRTPRQHNMYSIDLNNIVPHKDLTCFVAKASADESMLWHRRLGHLNFKTMNKLVRHKLVKGLPSKRFENNHTCVACLKGKQHKASCKTKLVNSVSKPLHTLHMDMFGPTSVSSLNHKWYCLVVTDDFSRFTWTFCLKTKDETSGILRNFITEIENLKDLKVKIIRCDNGGEFKNKEVNEFCTRKGIKREFSNVKTPQLNGVAERRNRTLIEAARTIKAFRVINKRTKKVEENLHVDFLDNKLIEKGVGPNWLFDIDTLTNSMNYVPMVVAGTSSTNISGTKDIASQGVKKDVSSLRYIALPNWFHEAHMESSNNDAQDACNADAPKISEISNPIATSKGPPAEQMESLIVESALPTVSSLIPTTCLDTSPGTTSGLRLISKEVISQKETPSLDNILTLSNRFEDILGDTTNKFDTNGVEADLSNMESIIPASPTHTFRIKKDHAKSQIIGPVDTPVQTRHKSTEMEEHSFIATIHQKINLDLLQFCLFSCFLSHEEHKKIFDALKDPSWVEDMQEVLLQFKIQNVWNLVDCPKGMDVKSAFLYGTIDEEVYVMQPLGFQDLEFLDRVYKVDKAMGKIDQTLFIRKYRGDFLVVQVYVDDIIFGSSNPQLCREFEALMYDKFQMSATSELNFFLGLHVLQKKDDIFLSQDKYIGDILKKFGCSDVRSANTPMEKENPWGKDRPSKDVELHMYRSINGSLMYLTASRLDIMFAVCAYARHQVTPKECHLHAVKRIFRYLKGHPKLGLWYPKESPFDLVAYSDSDYGGATQDRKSTTGGCQFLGRRLISWQCKKQTIVATSTTETEYVAAASGCGQVL
nr:hypothetical protein [Tanacetum cinerariifolium]